MKRRLMSSLLAFALLSSLVISAAAAETRSNNQVPSLSFDGTTANCSVSIMAIGKSITASLELWRDNIRVAKWSDSATSRLIISEEHSVTSGETYTLKVSGTIDGEPFTGTPVTRTCP